MNTSNVSFAADGATADNMKLSASGKISWTERERSCDMVGDTGKK